MSTHVRFEGADGGSLSLLLQVLADEHVVSAVWDPRATVPTPGGTAQGSLTRFQVTDATELQELGYLLFLLWLHDQRRRLDPDNEAALFGLDETRVILVYRPARSAFVLPPRGRLSVRTRLKPDVDVYRDLISRSLSDEDNLLKGAVDMLLLNAMIGGVMMHRDDLPPTDIARPLFWELLEERLREHIIADPSRACCLGGHSRVFDLPPRLVSNLLTDEGPEAGDEAPGQHSHNQYEALLNAWLTLRVFGRLPGSVGLASNSSPTFGDAEAPEIDGLVWSRQSAVLLETTRLREHRPSSPEDHFRRKVFTATALTSLGFRPLQVLYYHCGGQLALEPGTLYGSIIEATQVQRYPFRIQRHGIAVADDADGVSSPVHTKWFEVGGRGLEGAFDGVCRFIDQALGR